MTPGNNGPANMETVSPGDHTVVWMVHSRMKLSPAGGQEEGRQTLSTTWRVWD